MRGFRIASSYGRGIGSSTNGGSGPSVSNPGKLLWEGRTWKRRDNSRLVGNSYLGITSGSPVIHPESMVQPGASVGQHGATDFQAAPPCHQVRPIAQRKR